MKQNLLVFGLGIFLAGFSFPCSAQEINQSLPRLSTQGNQFSTPEGTPVSLRGVSLCSLEWHKPLEQIKAVTSRGDGWNANILRLPVQIKEWRRVGAQNYVRDYLDPAVERCGERGVYCIIDWHKIGAWDDPQNQKDLETFWSIVAPRYANRKNILYEIFNEPTSPGEMNRDNWLSWRDTAQRWVDLVRAKAPETPILIGSPHWSQMAGFAASDPFRGDNLAYTMHLYPNWPERKWDELFGDAANTIPVVITEWGWSAADKNRSLEFYGSLESYGEPLKSYLDARPHIGWTAWSYDPKCGPAMLGEDADMGAFVRQWLQETSR